MKNVYADLEELSRVILNGKQDEAFDEALNTLTEQEDTSSKVRLCLMDTQRALGFLVRKTRLPTNQLEQAREILRDIESLQPHNESLFQKVNFFNASCNGLHQYLNRTKFMKFFSVVSVMFLPATFSCIHLWYEL